MSIQVISQEEFLLSRLETVQPNYYLPHEMGFIDTHFDWLVKKQASHGKHLGQAMHEGAETFHDNAPAEAIVSDQEVLVNEVKKMRANLKNAVVVEYPKPSVDFVTLGTICLLNWGDDENELCYVAGEPNGYRDLDLGIDLTTVSVKSPVGSAIIGKKPGEKVSVHPQPGQNPFSIQITDLEQQAWPLEINLQA